MGMNQEDLVQFSLWLMMYPLHKMFTSLQTSLDLQDLSYGTIKKVPQGKCCVEITAFHFIRKHFLKGTFYARL